MYIKIESTPNPDVMKFLPGCKVSDEKIFDYPNARSHDGESPLASRLFSIEGVQGIMLGYDFISITRQTSVPWSNLKIKLQDAILAHYHSGEPLIIESVIKEKCNDIIQEDELSIKIKDLIELRVRPAVAMDGGDIQFHGFDKGIVYVTLRGACAGCPSSTITLKIGIENMLRYYIPEVIEVRTVI